MRCTPIEGYNWYGKCNESCPYWEGCKKQLGLPKDWKPAKYKRVETTKEDILKRGGLVSAYNTNYIYNKITGKNEPIYYKFIKIS